MTSRIVLAAVLGVLVVLGWGAPARAQSVRSIDHGGTYWGDVRVDRDQVVDGSVTDLFGTVTVAGTVKGDVTTVFGDIQEEPGSYISGHTNAVFGNDYAQAFAPWMPAMGGATLAATNFRLLMRLASSVVIVLVFLLFPVRVRVALDRVERHPGLSAAVGVLAMIAVVPVAILLFISFIGWPLIPLEMLAVVAGVFIGQAAVGLLVGRRLYEMIHPQTTPSPLAALIIGLVLVTAAELVPVVGYLVTGLVWLVGLGAAILAFIRESTFMTPPIASRPPIGGPPMTSA